MDHLAILPHTFIIGVAIILILITILLMCVKKNQSKQRISSVKSQTELLHQKSEQEDENQEASDEQDGSTRIEMAPLSGNASGGGEDFADYDDELEIYGKMEIKEELMKIGKDQYTLGEKLSTGSYAVVHKATIKKGKKSIAVAAKFPKISNERNKKFLTARLNFMANEIPRQVNVISLVAVDTTVPIMFLDLCEMGTLSTWVKALGDFTPEIDELIIRFCLDIANGLKHLHSIKVLHRRLGIRNVLLKNTSVRLIAKLTGFGPLEAEINTDTSKQDKVPIKWLPPESIERLKGQPRIYNEAVDMWSYGVTLWEMYSRGKIPYKNVTPWDLKTKLMKGEMLTCPKECLQSMYNKVLMRCWALEPSERPNAADICTTLSKLFLGENAKDYYYATGQIHEEDIEFYAYSESHFGIYENTRQPQGDYMNADQLLAKPVDPIYLQVIG